MHAHTDFLRRLRELHTAQLKAEIAHSDLVRSRLMQPGRIPLTYCPAADRLALALRDAKLTVSTQLNTLARQQRRVRSAAHPRFCLQANLKEQVQTAAAGVPEAAQGKGPAKLAADSKQYEAQCSKAFHGQRFLEDQCATYSTPLDAG